MSPPTEANDKYVTPCGVILAWNITKPIIVIGILFNDPGKTFKNIKISIILIVMLYLSRNHLI
jgi:hypothetical protein